MPHPSAKYRRSQRSARRAAGRARARRAGYRSGKQMTNLKRLIKQTVLSQQETKYVANQYDAGLDPLANQWFAVGSLGALTEWFPAMPALEEGTGDYQRIGDKIHPVSVAVSLKIFFNPQNIDANSIYGVIYYGTSKSVKSWLEAQPAGNAAILDQGDGTNTTFDGTIYKLNLPVDKKGFNLKRIVFRLAKTPGIQNSDISGNTVVGGNYSTANGMECKNFLLKIPHPKTVMYLNNDDEWPSNYAPFYGVGFCHADGSALQVSDQTLLKVSSHCHMYYKDA